MRIQITILALGLVACTATRSQQDLKSAENARYEHFKSNVHAQRNLVDKQHAERVSLANKQTRERHDASKKVFVDLASDNAKVDSAAATIIKDRRMFDVETRHQLRRLDARAEELRARAQLAPVSVRRELQPMAVSYYKERADLGQRLNRLGATSDAAFPSAKSAIEAHIRAADKTLDTVESKLK